MNFDDFKKVFSKQLLENYTAHLNLAAAITAQGGHSGPMRFENYCAYLYGQLGLEDSKEDVGEEKEQNPGENFSEGQE